MASHFADKLAQDNYFWRWVIIALHSAVQGFMVLAFRNKNENAIYDKKSTKKLYEADNEGGTRPSDLKLDSYLNLYKKVKQQLGFKPQNEIEKNIKELNERRNEFIHFTPKGWSLKVDGLPQICIDCAVLIEFLDKDIFWQNLNYHEQSQMCCYTFKKQMIELKQAYKNIGERL